MPFGLSLELITQIKRIFAKYPNIEKVIIYGSRAKGNYKKGSDIDLTCMGNNITEREWTNIQLALDDLLTPYTFDLSILSHIENSALIDHIHRVGKIFYERKPN